MSGPNNCPECGDEYIFWHGTQAEPNGYTCSNCWHHWVDSTIPEEPTLKPVPVIMTPELIDNLKTVVANFLKFKTIDEIIQHVNEQGFNLVDRKLFVEWLQNNFAGRFNYE